MRPGRNRDLIRGIIQDVTELKKAEEQIRHLAFFDGLTGPANREMFGDRLEKALAAGKRNSRLIALLFLDLDRFKRINDTLGLPIGEQLLKKIAALITSAGFRFRRPPGSSPSGSKMSGSMPRMPPAGPRRSYATIVSPPFHLPNKSEGLFPGPAGTWPSFNP